MSNAQTILAQQTSCKNKHGSATAPAQPPECMVISESQFLRSHTMYSAASSWLFAIAGATNIGVLCAVSSKVLTAVEQGKPLFKSSEAAGAAVLGNRKYNRIALGMVAFGGMCMAVSNWLESKKVVTEWQLGAGKLQRKVNIAEKDAAQAQAAQAALIPTIAEKPVAAKAAKNWVASVQPNNAYAAERSADR